MVTDYNSKSKPVLLLDFLLLMLLFLVFLLGVFVFSVNLSRRSGHDVTKIPAQIDPYGKVGTE